MRNVSRRGLLSTVAIGAASLSGCTGLGDSTGERDRETQMGTPAPELNTELSVQATAVAREGDASGRVTVGALVENPGDRPVAFDPSIRIGDTPVTGFQWIGRRGGDEERQVGPGQQRQFQATELLPADDYTVTHDGEDVTTVRLRPRDTPYALGTPRRSGPVVPSGGVGYRPELVTQFPLERPDGVDQTDGGTARLQAVVGDRLYVRVRWDTPDGERSSIAALDRWSGEEHWQQRYAEPSEVAVLDDTEYVLDGGTLRARTVDGTVRWENDIATVESVQRLDEAATYLVPTDDALFVSTDEGVKEVDPASGEVRRSLPGAFAAVGEDGLFTYGGQLPLAKFPLDGGTDPEWVARPSTGTGTGDSGAVVDDTVLVGSPAGYENADDARIELFAYDAATGEEQWSVVASRSRQVGGVTALPGLSDLRFADGAVFFLSNQGLRFVDVASGERYDSGIPETLGAGQVVASRQLTYGFTNRGDLNVASPAETPVTSTSGDGEPRPYRSVSIPEGSGPDLRGGPMLYGRGVLYLVSNGSVYGYSGAEEPQI